VVGHGNKTGGTAAAATGSGLQLAARAGAGAAAAPSAASSLQSTGDRPSGVLAMHAFVKHTLAAALFGLVTTSICRAQAARPADVAPRDAIATIIDAFRDHPIVGLNEGHGEERSHAFMLGLIRDPRFPSVVNDIVVEFGNSRYQDLIDRFIRGDEIPDGILRRVWQDTTIPHTIWDRPIYEQFFRTVRALNTTLPRDRRLRVLLGDPPVDWATVRTLEDLRRSRAGRGRHPADVVLREVLAKGRRALVLYGAGHLYRQNLQGANLIEHVETASGIRAFVVITHPSASLETLGVDPASWQTPRIALTRGSSLESQLDAVLYLGPTSGRTTSQLSRSLCADAEYVKMRAARMALAGDVDAAKTLASACGRGERAK
jgi:hypothetical protein